MNPEQWTKKYWDTWKEVLEENSTLTDFDKIKSEYLLKQRLMRPSAIEDVAKVVATSNEGNSVMRCVMQALANNAKRNRTLSDIVFPYV